MAEICIQKAELAHANKILEIQKLAFQSEAAIHNNYTIPPLVQTIESLKEDFSDYHFYIAKIGKNIVGSVKVKLVENNILWIGRLVVHPYYQNQGIGKKLMQFIEDTFKHVSAFELFTAEKSIRNISLYQKLGYVISGKLSEPGHSDIVLVRLVKTNN